MARILVAEDDLFIRDFLVRALTRAGHTVQAAVDGLTARECLLDNSYNLLIMHLSLPAYSAVNLLQEAKARSDTFPVLMYTAYTFPPEVVAQADSTLLKPFRLHDFLASVDGLLALTA